MRPLTDLAHGSIEWLGGLQAIFAHEMGHELYSGYELPLEPRSTAAAAALMEDLRVERRLLGDEPSFRPWLRLNLARAWPDCSAVRSQGEKLGWAVVLSLTAGRHAAGVVSDSELAKLMDALPNAAVNQAAAIQDIWAKFVLIADEDVAGTEATALAALLGDQLTDVAVSAILDDEP